MGLTARRKPFRRARERRSWLLKSTPAVLTCENLNVPVSCPEVPASVFPVRVFAEKRFFMVSIMCLLRKLHPKLAIFVMSNITIPKKDVK